MNIKAGLRALGPVSQVLVTFLVMFFSCEILYRRWYVDQIPTQFSASLVYTLLALNMVYVGLQIRFWKKTRKTVARDVGIPAQA